MFGKVSESDRRLLMDFICKEPSLNLFMIADIENYGFDADFIDVWCDVHDNRVCAALLRYHGSFLLYAPENHDNSFVIKAFKENGAKSLSGRRSTIRPYTELLEFRTIHEEILAQTDAGSFTPFTNNQIQVEKAVPEHAGALHRLRNSVVEFAEFPRSEETILASLQDPKRRAVVVMGDGEALATACTGAECDRSAMIGGVMTHPDHRRRGYASACLSALCVDLISEGKVCCLSYHNPAAGSVYNRLGFAPQADTMLCIV